MFNAKLIYAFGNSAPFTKGKTYQVVDFNDYFGTYTILNDNGERAALNWMRFEDRGYAARNYARAR